MSQVQKHGGTDAYESAPAQRWVVMGVSGCGKSEIGALLAHTLGLEFVEGDRFHPQANVDKMAAGIPLEDVDRQDWLALLSSMIGAAAREQRGLVLSCSSLKRRYRDLLRSGDARTIFIHLDGPRELIAQRMAARAGHFMPPALLDSQIRDLEALQADERGRVIDITQAPAQIVARAIQEFSEPRRSA